MSSQRRSRGLPLRTLATGAMAVCCSTVALSCGIPVSGEVEVLAQEEHLELLDGTTSTTVPVADPGAPDSTPVKLFFVGADSKLEFVVRDFTDDAKRNDVLNALESGPTVQEIEQFEGPVILQTFVPLGLSARFDQLDEETGAQRIVVDPEAGLRQDVEEQAADGRLIVSQIVCTVLELELPGVEGVEIYDGEEAIPLSDNAAQPIVGPAVAEDFGGCVTGAEERQAQLEAEAEAEGASTSTTAPNPRLAPELSE